MRLVRPLIVLALLATLAPSARAQRGGNPIPKLEAARAANPGSIAALRALGVAYYKAKRYADARTVLDHARRLDPKDGVSALYTGLSAEALGDFTNARAAYNSYIAVGRTRRVKNQIRDRLVALAFVEVVAAAKRAVANEATLSQTPGSPQTIAVPPLRFNGTDATLEPLERGLADLIITDLSRSAQLTIVERDRMQAIADEIQLSQTDRVDATTTVRAGKLIQAGRLVNGSILQTGNQLTLGASVVRVEDGVISDPAQVSNSLDALFAMQKQLVFEIFEQLGVRLTPAERQLVERRPTNNLNAFLAYSRGLTASDDGRFEDATRFFDDARALDPGFAAATVRFRAAQQAAVGAQVSSTTIESGLGTTVEGQQVTAAENGLIRVAADGLSSSLRNTLRNTLLDVNPSTITQVTSDTRIGTTPTPQLDPATSTTSLDDPVARVGTVVIIITRP